MATQVQREECSRRCSDFTQQKAPTLYPWSDSEPDPEEKPTAKQAIDKKSQAKRCRSKRKRRKADATSVSVSTFTPRKKQKAERSLLREEDFRLKFDYTPSSSLYQSATKVCPSASQGHSESATYRLLSTGCSALEGSRRSSQYLDEATVMSPIIRHQPRETESRHDSGSDSVGQEFQTSSSGQYPSKLQGLEHQPSHPRGFSKQSVTHKTQLQLQEHMPRGSAGAKVP